LYSTATQNEIYFYEVVHRSQPIFSAAFGPYVDVQPPTFHLQNSQWGWKIPWYAAVEMHIAYPGQP